MSSPPIAARRTLLGGVLGATALGSALAATSGQSAAAVGVPSSPAGKFFLDLPPIRGDSTDSRHRDQIEVLDWSVGVDGSVASGSGRRAGKSEPRPFTAVARSSIASPPLFAAAAQGSAFPEARFYGVSESADERHDYLLITLTNVQVTSYAMAPDDIDATPTDVFELVYDRLQLSWTPQDAAGRPGAAVVAGYDFKRGRAL